MCCTEGKGSLELILPVLLFSSETEVNPLTSYPVSPSVKPGNVQELQTGRLSGKHFRKLSGSRIQAVLRTRAAGVCIPGLKAFSIQIQVL